jgi:hypothetical protein
LRVEKKNFNCYCFVGLWGDGLLDGDLAEFHSRIITHDLTMNLPVAAPCPLAAAVPNRGLNRPGTNRSQSSQGQVEIAPARTSGSSPRRSFVIA